MKQPEPITYFRKHRVGETLYRNSTGIHVSARERAERGERDVVARMDYYDKVLVYEWIGPGGCDSGRGWVTDCWLLTRIEQAPKTPKAKPAPVETAERRFEIETVKRGDVRLYEVTQRSGADHREWCQTFGTLRAAKAALAALQAEEALVPRSARGTSSSVIVRNALLHRVFLALMEAKVSFSSEPVGVACEAMYGEAGARVTVPGDKEQVLLDAVAKAEAAQ